MGDDMVWPVVWLTLYDQWYGWHGITRSINDDIPLVIPCHPYHWSYHVIHTTCHTMSSIPLVIPCHPRHWWYQVIVNTTGLSVSSSTPLVIPYHRPYHWSYRVIIHTNGHTTLSSIPLVIPSLHLCGVVDMVWPAVWMTWYDQWYGWWLGMTSGIEWRMT